jgi:hypothetical protein
VVYRRKKSRKTVEEVGSQYQGAIGDRKERRGAV